MAEVICVRVIWDRRAVQLGRLPGRWHDLHLGPEPGHPFGRKGLALSAAWAQLQMSRKEDGMLVMDGDVAADPADIAAMLAAAGGEPGAVHVAPVRLWPASTRRRGWTWAHHRGEPSQEPCEDPVWFSFCLTYLPRRLLRACEAAGLRRWAFPDCDARVAGCALKEGIPVRVVEGARPCHLNY